MITGRLFFQFTREFFGQVLKWRANRLFLPGRWTIEPMGVFLTSGGFQEINRAG